MPHHTKTASASIAYATVDGEKNDTLLYREDESTNFKRNLSLSLEAMRQVPSLKQKMLSRIVA